MKSVGIEVGQHSIKWVELNSQGKSLYLSGHGRTVLKNTPGMDHELEVMETLREVLSQFTDPSTKFVAAIGQDRLSMKVKRFPFKEKHKILKALPFEMEDELPLAGEQILYDFKPITFYGKKAEVLALAIPRSEVSTALSTASDSGLNPDILSIESAGLANLIEGWDRPVPLLPESASEWDENFEGLETSNQPLSPARVLLHLGHTKSLMLIFRDNRLIGSRSIYWGGLRVAQSISSAFSIPVAEAIKGLPEKSFILLRSEGATKDQLRLSEAVTSSLGELIREVKISLLESQSLLNLDIQKMELTGSLSLISNLPGYLTQKFEIPVNSFRYVDSAGVYISGWDAKDEATFSLPLGLALETYKRPSSYPINLRQNEFQKRNRTIEQAWTRWRIPVQTAVAAFVLFLVFAAYRSSLSSELMFQAEENLTQRARVEAGLSPSRATTSNVQVHIRSRRSDIRNSETAQKLMGLKSAMAVMKSISAQLPPPRSPSAAQPVYVVNSLQVDFDRVRLTGTAQNASSVRQIEQSLVSLARGGRVQRLPSANTTGPEVSFGFEFQVDRL